MAVRKSLAILSVLCTLKLVYSSTISLGQPEIPGERQSKNLFPFVWVTFKPSPCGDKNGGVCVQRGKCTKKGGISSGMCQDNIGECCLFTAQCNVNKTTIEVDQLVTTLQAPSPRLQDSPCTFKFKKEPNICQIRLDLDNVQMMSANPEGDCVDERLVISSSITVNDGFTTCGKLSKQHMYLTYGSQDAIEVTALLQASTNSDYKIVATRIPCDSQNRAPDYCLQYFTKSTDIVTSFDYGTQQQNNQRYTACVKPLVSSKSVTWKPCTPPPSTGSAFDIITAIEPPTSCNTDYVVVRGEERRCGSFPQITSPWKPYELMVNFDATEIPEPLPGFNIYVDPSACNEDTNCKGVMGAYSCGCLGSGTNQTCQCELEIPDLVGSTPDFENKGFCLSYSQ